MGRSRGYAIFLSVLILLLLAGIVLLVYGSLYQGAAPRPTLMVPMHVQYG